MIMASIPCHTSHRLQPLVLTFYGSLKAAFNSECDLYLKTSVYDNRTQYKLAQLFNRAYLKVTALAKGICGFTAAGIWPLKPQMFTKIQCEGNKET
jgi:hypothetical protein